MHESEIADILEAEGIDLVLSLPCDRNKAFTDLVHERFETVDLTREEDGVGISAGAVLAGRKPVISIQSSGLGNMMNAIMSLTDCYRLPMVVLASWRGVDGEKIEAQIPFNSRIPEMLDCYGIGHRDVATGDDLGRIAEAIREAYDDSTIQVVLIHPSLWGGSGRVGVTYPERRRSTSVHVERSYEAPTMTRLDAIRALMSRVGDDDIVVSNIGVPSKEVMAARDRPLNFYMLGSYTQATPIGIGMALSTDRRVVVVDGDGSLLGSSIYPVLSSLDLPNLTVVCLDNGAFGSTGNQMNQAYLDVDLSAVAAAYGLEVVSADTAGAVAEAMDAETEGTLFVHVPILPFNSDSPNIPYRAAEIRDRFVGALR